MKKKNRFIYSLYYTIKNDFCLVNIAILFVGWDEDFLLYNKKTVLK
jgi:hypothetical protein